MTGRVAVLRAILGNATLRRVEAAFLAFSVGEWATWIAIVIYAYGRGGATEAGVVAFVQLVPSLFVAPLIGSFGDRHPRAAVLVGTYVIQGASMAAAAAALAFRLDALVVYALATLTATAVTLTRPVHTAFLPEVVDTPDELTAANVASGTIEGAGSLVGPALAGVLVGLGGPGLTFAVTACGLLLGAALVAPVGRRAHRHAPGEMAVPVVGHELLGGVVTILGDGRLRALAGVLAAACFVLGALDIFYAVLAIDLLGLGEGGVGLLGSATGIGMIVGGTLALSLVGRRGLGRPLLIAATVLGTAVMLVAGVPAAALAAVLLGIAGIGFQYVSITVQTMTQRIVPDVVLSRVLGVFEGLLVGATGLGALAVPVLVALLGQSGAFVAAGLIMPIVAGLAARTLLAADRTTVVLTREVNLLRGIPMFAPLSAPVLESLSRALVPQRVAAGATIIRQGDPGDRYYVIAGGSVAIEVDGRHVHDHGAGEGFGEIALLRDVPRTATVRALDDVELFTLAREPFLAALTGQSASRLAAERLVSDRLAGAG